MEECFGLKLDMVYALSTMYGYCRVHFDRCKVRVANNGNIVPARKKRQFIQHVDQMMACQIGQFDKFMGLLQQFKREYPTAKCWIEWFLVPKRAPICFPACKDIDSSKMERALKRLDLIPYTINAQESANRHLKRLLDKKGQNPLGDVLVMTVKWFNIIEHSIHAARRGIPDRYGRFRAINKDGRRKKKKRQVGDHRPPDTTSRLIENRLEPGDNTILVEAEKFLDSKGGWSTVANRTRSSSECVSKSGHKSNDLFNREFLDGSDSSDLSDDSTYDADSVQDVTYPYAGKVSKNEITEILYDAQKPAAVKHLSVPKSAFTHEFLTSALCNLPNQRFDYEMTSFTDMDYDIEHDDESYNEEQGRDKYDNNQNDSNGNGPDWNDTEEDKSTLPEYQLETDDNDNESTSSEYQQMTMTMKMMR